MQEHRDHGPAAIRAACWERQGGLCALCWRPLGQVDGQWEAHHRLRRRDLPGWCGCNIVGLHPRCHTQGPSHPGLGPWAVHDHPDDARALGLIVATHEDPRTLPLARWGFLFEGPVWLACDTTLLSALAVNP